MPNLNYNQVMTGVEVPRREILNARPWAIVKLIGFIITCFTVTGLLLLGGAMLAGARINFHTPAVALAPVTPAPVATPIANKPATPAAETRISISLPPEIRVVVPPQTPSRQPQVAPSSDDELEQQFKEKLLAEEVDP